MIRRNLLLLILLYALRLQDTGAAGEARYELIGKVTQADGKAFTDVTPIASLHSNTSPFSSRTPVDAGGQFKLKKLLPDMYTLIIMIPRSAALRRTIEVSQSLADSKRRIYLTLVYERKPVAGRPFNVSASQLAVPDSARAEYRKGIESLEKRETERAIEAFQKALMIAPQFTGAHNRLGEIYYQTRRYSLAEEQYREALQYNPNLFGPLVNLGGVLIAQQKYEESLQINLRAERARPDEPLVQTQLGHCFFYLGRFDDAELHLKKAKSLEPSHFSFPQLMLAQIYWRREDFTASAQELDEFLRLHPNSNQAPEVRRALDAIRSQQERRP